MEIRNIAIIAHVDHGKTTLTDAIMRQTGMFEDNMSMDINALEQERGITIYAKNTATFYKGTKINIVDTPGHADFGSEVERVLRSIDSVVLVVDAQEGPMPQTRFVLKKSLELGFRPIVVINKIDKPAADPERTEEQVLELFLELGASDQQTDFTVVYAVGKDGVAMRTLDGEHRDISPLLDIILEQVPCAENNRDIPLRAQPFNLGYDNFLGRLAVARIYEGVLHAGDTVQILTPNGNAREGKINKLFTFRGVAREEVREADAGDIVMIAGLADVFIGETICIDKNQKPLPAIEIDEPTITLNFLVNNSPFAGREGKFLTSRQIRERLMRELEVNVGLKVDFSEPDRFKIFGRGELHVAILLENMRREGYEIQVSQPRVIIKEIDGQKKEPYEEVTIDVPSEFQGAVIEKLGKRRAILKDMRSHNGTVRLIFEGPTRGFLGYRGQFLVDTKGKGICASRVLGFRPYAGEIEKRALGSMTSMISGKTLAYALANLQERGALYIGPGVEVYEGMVIGGTSKGDELRVNPVKGKQLTNMRAAGSDENIYLAPPFAITIENGLEIIREDEYLEITPASTRIRKQYLTEADRSRARRGG
ncbi:MAG: GTP-binding protein TypA [Candidatus Ryanbacteria bacterium RIFCSPHIGHO2_12_FULL_47_12b]|uniref:50S ribosomal subunit assembly factor BipA n=3 Tax=Parcubacteria group TaxID=1794811 RepID=A0A1G2H546_9BACT|nr:MAG: GTP-binding protein TypA/BipA [Parcubacteria group bacterium GW2011_GWA2_47_10b]KKU75404.1 MAG: GTP-binding protein TypA/BipA [Candidatus Giovannonibacteria bacterium GW2011_GWB1_47_6b]KKU86319.1 MAG: GTP-binding protein TypA/BipA [Parcubacteria group bacterium GW2011_GWA1_47_9]OGZ51501.1 MAG: GTP-binding protein TypA [Candidatus Ryanbacteria bacterium RIFCSPHIGHO2_12_FULL_47_12b]OGZ54865.1 MAG: GTP-binding protein TypA [Candidatus Ryanbacteria bacterium RIFCSPLOWO2_02_FULL_47_14]OGZ57